MLCKTRGVVLHQIKYAETSLIVKIYTELFGLQSYIFKGIRTKKSSIKSNIFQPLSLVEMVVDHKEKSAIQFVKEVRNSYQFISIPHDVRKSSIVLFLNELINKSIKEEEANNLLFNYIYDNIVLLDSTEENFSDFHLFFTMHLTSFLGFVPSGNYSDTNCYFNLREGIFQKQFFEDEYYLDKSKSSLLHQINNSSFDFSTPSTFSRKTRNEILKSMISYYLIHIPSMKKMNTLDILEEVFN